MKAKSKNAIDAESSIDNTSLRVALTAVEQPNKSLARCRIRHGNFEFAAVDSHHVVLCESRMTMDGFADSPEFDVDRGVLEALTARSCSDVALRLDSDTIEFRSEGHIYSSTSQPEPSDIRDIEMPNKSVRVEMQREEIRRLTRPIESETLVFEVSDGALWLSGHSVQHGQIGGRVRVPSEHVTIPSGCDSRTMLDGRVLSRCLDQVPFGADDCMVIIGDQMPVSICASIGSVETRHVIAPVVPGDEEDRQ